tara:strand:- start:124 stop:555 length:432 start_codon:yes stop_codon:yes gene_type:complete
MACRVDFYVQVAGTSQGHLTLACRVTEKAYQAGHRIYLRCQNEDQANQMDALLWTFSQSSFVPHQLSTSGRSDALVTIGHARPSNKDAQVVVSLADAPVTDFDEFARVAEIVGGESAQRDSGRKRFRFYRDQGLDPVTHEIRL